MKIYYAHSLAIYDTPQEERDLEFLKKVFPEAEIINPNEEVHRRGYKALPEGEGMNYFRALAKSCDLVVFRAHIDGMIGAGVYTEAFDCGVPCLELPTLPKSRQLTVEETRDYLTEIGSR